MMKKYEDYVTFFLGSVEWSQTLVCKIVVFLAADAPGKKSLKFLKDLNNVFDDNYLPNSL